MNGVFTLPSAICSASGRLKRRSTVSTVMRFSSIRSPSWSSLSAISEAGSAYHPAVLLKIYIYGYLNLIQTSRRLEREAERNVELMWLTGRLAPDFKTIADFRKTTAKPFAAYAASS